jgi:hypothetical protein
MKLVKLRSKEEYLPKILQKQKENVVYNLTSSSTTIWRSYNGKSEDKGRGLCINRRLCMANRGKSPSFLITHAPNSWKVCMNMVRILLLVCSKWVNTLIWCPHVCHMEARFHQHLTHWRLDLCFPHSTQFSAKHAERTHWPRTRNRRTLLKLECNYQL